MSHRWLMMLLIFSGMVISYIDRGNLSIAAVPMMRDFQLSPALMGGLLSAFYWAYGACQLPAGAVVDRFGSKRAYSFAFVLWSLASASISLSRHLPDVFAMRVLLGIAESVGPVASLALIRSHFQGPEQGVPMAIYTSAQYLGPALGARAGTLLMEHFGWRHLFALTGLGALAWLPFWLWLAPRDRRRIDGQPAEVYPASAALGVILRQPAFWTMSACCLGFSYYWAFVLTWVPSYLTMARGFGTVEMGSALFRGFAMMAVVTLSAGYLADRIIRRNGSVFRTRLTFGICGLAGGASMLSLIVLQDKAVVAPVLTFAMCSMGVAMTNFWTISQHTPPKHLVGRTIGYMNTLSQVASALAPIITGHLIGPEKQFGTAILVAGICLLAACAALLVTGARGLEKMKALLAGEPA